MTRLYGTVEVQGSAPATPASEESVATPTAPLTAASTSFVTVVYTQTVYT